MVETSNVTERERDDKSLHNTQMPQNSHVEGVGTKVQKLSEKDRKNMVVYFLGGGRWVGSSFGIEATRSTTSGIWLTPNKWSEMWAALLPKVGVFTTKTMTSIDSISTSLR